jgi:hypothetical protein
MSLDVRIKGIVNNYLLSFDDDGYYWYLYPFFEELRKRTGINIDLYGDAMFNRGNLNQLETVITKVCDRLKNEPDTWSVSSGMQTHPVKRVLFSKVTKKEFESKLKLLSEMIDTVKSSDAILTFCGD